VFDAGRARLKPIRHLEDAHDLVKAIVATCFASYKSVVTQYRADEMPALHKKYTQMTGARRS
jgi:hypothetical protein